MLSRLVLWVVGATIGIAIAILLQPQLHGEMVSIPFPIWGGALLGWTTAESFWRLL
jgi:hypothetical protein